MPLTFVVGTGRCGSTLLSRILNEHPDAFAALRAACEPGTQALEVS